ncbi:AMP-binding protein [Poseidonocella sp. HB161398]|uniref:AMP-binding protein n=1 Tax=Poseidonocella sp. HB161398 TaxID=2320855 RepID=UPI001108FCA2|nr:AMP-binding protein [Poseidonocella sp. HB161398]
MLDLTEMQAANWVGGHSAAARDGVTAHLYTEFDGEGLDPARLEQAVAALYARHPGLRLAVAADGSGRIAAAPAAPLVRIEDLRGLAPEAVGAALGARRQAGTHQRLALEDGRGMELRLSLLPGGRQRLHLDIDMVPADPSCFPAILDELAGLCRGEAPVPLPAPAGPAVAAMPAAELRDWWSARLDALPPAPVLPLPAAPEGPATTRLAAQLSAAEAAALRRAAREARVTVSALMQALFTALLGRATGQQAFRLNMPHFLRAPGEAGQVGDFSGILPFAAELSEGESLAALSGRSWRQMAALLSRREGAGPGLLRELSRRRGTVETAPVVFTSGLDIGGGGLVSARARAVFGELVWTVSQGPGVALDVQLAAHEGGILANWDLRLDMIEAGWAEALFDAHVAAMRRLAAEPALMESPLGDWLPGPRAVPLTPMQEAYLMGRGGHMPLGGISMQELRVLRGDLPLEALRDQLGALVARHPGLRTVIDAEARVARVAERHPLNLDTRDLSGLSPEAAEARLVEIAAETGNSACPLDRAPWHVLAVALPEGAADRLAIFLRFDALTLDGASIAALVAELGGAAPAAARPAVPAPAADPARDTAYWQERIAGMAPVPDLPWRAPLDQLGSSRYRRLSRTLPRAVLARLARAGAGAGLFRNSVLSAVVLEVLARWTPDLSLRIGVPVAPPPTGLAEVNRSSFLPVSYRVTADADLAARAQALQAEIHDGLGHGGIPGVAINRMLLARDEGAVALPVVVTNGLGWARPPSGELREAGGLTRTPQTALDLRLVQDAAGDLRIDADFAEAALEAETVAEILDAAGRALEAVAETGELVLPADAIPAPPDILSDCPEGDADFLGRIAARLFGGSTETALVCGTVRLGADALGRLVSTAIAGFRARGLVPGDVVALVLPKSVDHVVLQLAAALEGLVWVPVDASSPPERLDYLLETCAPRMIVSRAPLEGRETVAPAALLSAEPLPGWPVPAETLAARSRDAGAAFYLFTSGTTGRPKGVVLTNLATGNVLAKSVAHWGMGPGDSILSATPLHHDMSIFDLFGGLSAGARVVLPEEGMEKDARRWAELVRAERLTFWCSVPTILEMLLAAAQPGDLASIRLIVQGGDFVKPATVARLRGLLPGARLISIGGPTETTIWSIWHDIAPGDTGQIPYGRTIPGAGNEILNPLGERCPAGVRGRIHTTGICLALGYLAAGGLSQADFLTLADGRRAFRTGDEAWRRRDGTVMFATRVNGYVKIRGVRVSLTDVEDALARHPGLSHAVAVDLGDAREGEVTLAALVVPAPGQAPDAGSLRGFLRGLLPETHIPSDFVTVEALPVSANGKPDRRRAREIAAAPPLPAGRSAEVLGLYLGVTGGSAEGAGPETPFLSLGLRPAHLRAVAEALNGAFGTRLAPAELLPCRSAREVETLLARHAARS